MLKLSTIFIPKIAVIPLNQLIIPSLPSVSTRKLAAKWLILSVFALLGSGFPVLLLLSSRVPVIHELVPWLGSFKTALVIHVNLAVVVWFIAFAGVLWLLISRPQRLLWDKLILALITVATLLMILSPFSGEGHPLINNYVPVLQQPMFLSALSLLGIGFTALVLRSLCSAYPLGISEKHSPLSFGIYGSMIAALIALITLVWAALTIPASLTAQAYYELLFWGSGHSLQFMHSFLLIVAWLWLASASGIALKLSTQVIVGLFVLMLVPVLLAPVIYLLYETSSAEHRLAFTDLMKYGGLTTLPLGAWVTLRLLLAGKVKAREQRPYRSALYNSIILFAAGGIIGFLIHGANVVIPAHYHGSIVGVTLAFMGLSYYLLPHLGFHQVPVFWANLQPYLYGGGQLLHILGLAWSGGYGVQRKTAGSAQGLDSLPETLGMALVGVGGAISVVGGMMFLVLVLRAMFIKKH